TGQLATDPFRSVAPALMRAQIPAVVAMQFRVPEEATLAFSSEFYRALTEGLPLDTCITEGRRAVMNISGIGRPDWGIPVVYTRAQDGRLFDPATEQAAPTPVQAMQAPIPRRDDQPTIGAGLNALRDMVQTPGPVRDAAVAFRTDFQAAGEQIEMLGTYKDIHDQLHSLQVYCFNLLILETRRASIDDIAWDSLSNYEMTLQGIVAQLQEIAKQSSKLDSELTWTNDVGQARVEMASAIEALDLPQLKKAARLINRVLMIQPAQVNVRLSAAARALRLPTLVQGLSKIHENLPMLELDAEKVAQFETAVLALDRLSNQLLTLVGDHDRHQAIDLELRQIETTIDQDLDEFELSWPDLKTQAGPLYEGIDEAWSTAVRTDAEKLDAALAAKDPTKIRHFFRRYRRQMGDRFYRVDIDLKRLCDELRKVGDPLTSVLRVIA
ncbi:MAG: CHAT domain-containing protein, partial [Roseiflexaceae bacterium]|nr:CHAT domain-containing protein [Roseiflexaceae bacterium]